MIQKERNRAGRSGTLMKSVYHSLKEDICNGVIKTGELLSEAQLAEPAQRQPHPRAGGPGRPGERGPGGHPPGHRGQRQAHHRR